MRRLSLLLLALLLSGLLYVAVVSIVRRPLTIGDIPEIMQTKYAHARSLPSPKLVVFAGSNGRYSHRCATLTEETGMPCTNLSVAVGIGLDFQLTEVASVLKPGDVVYMPLEFAQYATTREEMQAGTENALLVHYYRDRLWQLGPDRILRAYASFDLTFLVHGVIEMALDAHGFRRRSGGGSMSPEGDERGHTPDAARAYADYLQTSTYRVQPLPRDSHAQAVIGAFLDAAHARGVRVFGGWPTIPDDAVEPAGNRNVVRTLFERHGQGMLDIPGGSRYPLTCFFDTHSHLNENCQIRHSRVVGAALRERLRLEGRA